MSKDTPEADPSQVFLDALRRFVELADLWLASQSAGPEPPRYPRAPITLLILDAIMAVDDASNAWDWPTEEQETPSPEMVAINWAYYVLEDIKERLFLDTRGEEYDGTNLVDILFNESNLPEQLRALKLALDLARVAPGKPLRPEDFVRFLALRGKTHREDVPERIQCSQTELLDAMSNHISNK